MRRCGLATASAALIRLGALLALAVATPTVAWEPDGRHAGGSGGERGGGAAVGEMPGRWFRYSRESFQQMMNLLAERSSPVTSASRAGSRAGPGAPWSQSAEAGLAVCRTGQ